MLFRDQSQQRGRYFLGIQDALKREGIGHPVMVIDRERLRANCRAMRALWPKGMDLRIVAKSLPNVDLLRLVLDELDASGLMTFNAPMLGQLAGCFPDHHQLLGKPLSINDAARVLGTMDPAAKVTWLVDTEDRFHQYRELARAQSRRLSIALEIDVGLHRGGLATDQLAAVVRQFADQTDLTFGGLMGYEPHIGGLPEFFGLRKRALAHTRAAYRAAVSICAAQFGDDFLCNGGGSASYFYHLDDTCLSEMSVGSVLVKPTDFDLAENQDVLPAAFIAAPVLKKYNGFAIPGGDGRRAWLHRVNPNLSQVLFIHGGYWKAVPEDPPGLRQSGIFGRSTNQEALTLGRRADIRVDDFVFLRPTQSERVLTQFGDIVVYENGQVVDYWSAMPTTP